MQQRDDETYNTLAKAPPRMVEDVENDIPSLDEAIKQSDVMDHVEKAVKDVQ